MPTRIVFNGREYSDPAERQPRAGDDPDLPVDPLETTTEVLSGIVRVTLVLSAVAVIVLATLMFRNMDESSASQGGRPGGHRRPLHQDVATIAHRLIAVCERRRFRPGAAIADAGFE
jgi:hypothetical protein